MADYGSKDRQNLVKGVLYLIRDVFCYKELVEIRQFIVDIMQDKDEEINKLNNTNNYKG